MLTSDAVSPIVELRQYTLRPGQRETLIELFDREFVETQEALGMELIGQFRDLDDPDRFVWLRGFQDMRARAESLEAFYGGPVWKEHREAANSRMLDSDDVLLLRIARPGSGFSSARRERAPRGTTEVSHELVVATIYHLGSAGGGSVVDLFERALEPALAGAGATVLAYFVTERSTNTFPALPVRENENVFVTFSRFANQEAYEQHARMLARSRPWQDADDALQPHLAREPEVLRLSPTSRSRV